MAAIWMRMRAELRASWRALVSLALIAGLASGFAIAAVAGARRTVTAYPRFVRAQDGFDATTGGGSEGGFARRWAALRTRPEIADLVETVVVAFEVILPERRGKPALTLSFFDGFAITEPSGRYLYEINRAKVLQGRLPDRSEPDEAFVPFSFADRQDVRLGDTITIGVGVDTSSRASRPVEYVDVRVVGIGAAPGDFEAVGQQTVSTIYVTPALFERYRESIPFVPDVWGLGIRLREGASVAAFKQTVEIDYDIDVPWIEPVVTEGVQKTMRLYAAALWFVGGLVWLAALAIVGQTLARQIHLDAADFPALRSLGMTRRDLMTLGLMRAGIVSLVACVLAVVVASVLSPATPIGAARIAEPAPGFAFDAVAIGLGALATVLAFLGVAAVPAFRAARAELSGARSEAATRPSVLVTSAARSGRSPSLVAGLRMALEPGHGRTAVPVRSTIVAVAIGVAAVTAALTVGRSLDHLLDHQQLAGLTYDAIVVNESELPDERVAARLERFPFIEAMTEGTGVNINIAGVDSWLVAFREGDPVGFALISGRTPTATLAGGLPEVALGTATMRRLGVRLGDEVTFSFPFHEEDSTEDELSTGRARVVGVAAIPPLPWAAMLPGEGGVITTAGLATFSNDDGLCCFARFADGTDLVAARAALQKEGFQTVLRTRRADLVTLERLTNLPVVLSSMFALIALAALAHVLVTGIRRRRRDLAVLKTLGFVNRQVRGALAWQATVIATLCVAAGIPVGIALGRWGWNAVAQGQFGVVPVSVAPVAVLALAVPGVLLLANVIAVLPARSAARTQPAVVLRTE